MPLRRSGVDERIVIRNLALSPAERLDAFKRRYDNVRALMRSG